MRRFQESVRITVQLVDVATNRQIWGNTYKGKLDDIFDIQEQVAQQIVEALKLKLSFSEKVSLTKRQTVNAQAYDLYLRGQDYLYRLTQAQRRVRDPAVREGHRARPALRGRLCRMFQRLRPDVPVLRARGRYRDKAQELSFKALMYDSNLPEAYTAMGLSYFIWGKFDEASASSSKAIELDPDDFIAHWTLGRIHFSTGELEQALALFRRVIEIKPGFYVGVLDLAADLRRARTHGRGASRAPPGAGAAAELPAAEPGRCARANVSTRSRW